MKRQLFFTQKICTTCSSKLVIDEVLCLSTTAKAFPSYIRMNINSFVSIFFCTPIENEYQISMFLISFFVNNINAFKKILLSVLFFCITVRTEIYP